MAGDRARLHVMMLLNGCYPPPLGGGMEMQVRTLARGLRRRGHFVTVVAPLNASGPQRRVDRVDGTPVFRVPFPRIRLLGGGVLLLRLGLFLWSRRDRYDAWHVHSPSHMGAVAALLASVLAKPRAVVKIASAAESEDGILASRPGLHHRAIFFGLRRAHLWQAISRRIADALARRGIPGNHIAAIPNAVDTHRFEHPREAASHVRFLFIGRLVSEKNLPDLLKAFALTLRQHPRAHLRIVGGGPLEAALRSQASDLGIADSVEFAGHRSDVAAVLAGADIGVLPSQLEGLSNTLLECMASGLPMIASRVSGSEDLVRPGENGWLFEPGDIPALATCLAEAAVLPSSRLREMGDAARATVERHAGLESVLTRLLAAYRGSVPCIVSSASAAHPPHGAGISGEER